MFSYNCSNCEKFCEIKNKPRKNRFSGICKDCSVKKTALNRIKVSEDGFKLCKKCNESKPASTDYFLKDKKGYYYPYCRECKKEYLSERYVPSSRLKLSGEELIERNTARINISRVNKWAKHLVNSSRHNAKRYEKEFDIDEEYILELYEKQNQKCYWYGVLLEPSIVNRFPSKPSLDRLDPHKGYIKGNVVISCMAANIGRNSCDAMIFENFCKNLRNKDE
jgi:hypothetical protein